MTALTASPSPSSVPAAVASVAGRAVVVLATMELVARVVLATSGGEDAGLGAGLAGFGATALLCGAWATLDARRNGFGTSAVAWALTSALAGTGSLVLMSFRNAGDGSTVLDMMAVDASSAGFVFFLCAVPAAIGAGLASLRPRG